MKIKLDKERVIVRGMRPEERPWGPYQFPRPYNLGDRIVVSVHVEEDDIYNPGKTARWFESRDEGETWTEIDASVAPQCGLLLPNGDRFYFPTLSGIELKDYKIASIDSYTPDYDFHRRAEEKTLPVQDGMTFFHYGAIIKAYDADRLPESISRKEWIADRIPAGQSTPIREKVAVDWPHLTRVVIFHTPESVGILKPIQPRGNLKLGPDGAIWVSAFSGEGHISDNGQYSPYYCAELFRSQDNGKSFTRQGHIEYPADGNEFPYQSGGFSDSDFEFMPDGSIVWFLRSTWAAYTGREWDPMYMTRSTDNGKTWSKPKKFSEMGVLPRLCTLPCGATLLCYARPGLFVSVCENDSGTQWSKPITVIEPKDRSNLANIKADYSNWHEWDGQCGNPEIIPLGYNTALLFYGDFYYPDEKGVKRKTILCRKITVEMD